jgi:hypothetical protein
MQQGGCQLSPDEWREQLLASGARETPEQEARFLSLVDMVAGRVTPYVASALLGTFSDRPGLGSQERVCSVLAGAPVDTQVTAILEELPCLNLEAPASAEALLGDLVEHDLLALKRHLHFATAETRLAVRVALSRSAFCERHPKAEELRAYCR